MPFRPLKILMLSYWFPPKIAPAPYELAKHLVTLGHEVFVISGVFNNAPHEEVLNGVQLIRVKQHFPSFPGHITYGLKTAKLLVKLHRSERFDITHVNGADGWFISKLNMKNELRTPIMVTMHGSARRELDSLQAEGLYSLFSLFERTHWKVQYYFDKWSLESADKVAAVSRQTANDVVKDYGIPAKNIEVVFNGVDTDHFSPERCSSALKKRFGGKFLILYVGRLRFRKGVQYLIKALPLVVNDCDAHLVVVGEGEAKMFLRHLVRDIGMDEHVTFVGTVSDNELSAYYASSDVFVCPSLYEPFGLVCLEALASGTPLILSGNVGAKEIVSEDVAKVVKAGDEVDLASAILEIARDERKRRSMAVKGRRLAEKYDWINIARKVCDVYADA